MDFRNLFCLFLMAVGKTLATDDWWNALRMGNSGGINLRQTETISYQCTSSGTRGCLDCGSYPFCPSAGTMAYKIVCKAGEVCQNTATGGGSCVIYSDPKVTDCKCTAAYVDDPYETTGNKYLTCLVGKPPILSVCPTGQVFDFSLEKCNAPSALPTCSEGPGNFLVNCRQGYFCPALFDPPLLYTPCTSSELFDPTIGSCVPAANVKIPDFTCSSTVDGAQADTLECNAFYVCVGGSMQGATKFCCSTGQVFSETLMRCTPDSAIDTCPKVHPCDTHTYTYVCSSSTSTISTPSSTVITGIPTTTTTTTTTTTKTLPTTTTTTTTATAATTTTTTTSSSPCTVTSNSTSCSNPVCTTNGAMAYPCNCKYYYWCASAGGTATLNKCGTSLYFNSATKTCTTLSQCKGCSL